MKARSGRRVQESSQKRLTSFKYLLLSIGISLFPQTGAAQWMFEGQVPTVCPTEARPAALYNYEGAYWNFYWRKSFDTGPNSASYFPKPNPALSVDSSWRWTNAASHIGGCWILQYYEMLRPWVKDYRLDVTSWVFDGTVVPYRGECEAESLREKELLRNNAAGTSRRARLESIECQTGGGGGSGGGVEFIGHYICYWIHWYDGYTGEYLYSDFLGCVYVESEALRTTPVNAGPGDKRRAGVADVKMAGGTVTIVLVDSLDKAGHSPAIIRRADSKPLIVLSDPAASVERLADALSFLRYAERQIAHRPGLEMRIVIGSATRSSGLDATARASLNRVLAELRVAPLRNIPRIGVGRAIEIAY